MGGKIMKRKLLALIIIFLFLTTIIPLTVTSENTNQTIYVDDDNIIGPWDGTIEHPYQHIQDGINAAYNNDHIYVKVGIYEENITIKKQISLIGEDNELTIIKLPLNEDTVLISSEWVNFSNFKIIKNDNTLKTEFDNDKAIFILDSIHCKVTNIVIESDFTTGIRIFNSAYCMIYNNRIIGSCNYGIILEGSNNTIKNNLLENVYDGISFSGLNTNVIGNQIRAGGSGQFLSFGIGSQGIDLYIDHNINIHDNEIIGFPIGIQIVAAEGYSISYNKIKFSLLGIFIIASESNQITNNDFIFNLFNIICGNSINNMFDRNFYGRPRLLPKPIINILYIPPYFIPIPILLILFDFDFLPRFLPMIFQNMEN